MPVFQLLIMNDWLNECAVRWSMSAEVESKHIKTILVVLFLAHAQDGVGGVGNARVFT